MKRIIKILLPIFVFLSASGCITTTYRVAELDTRLPKKRHRHVSAMLGDGTVGIFGGWAVYGENNVFILDLRNNRISSVTVSPPPNCDYDLSGIGLNNGNVLLINGEYEAVYDYRKKQIFQTENALQHEYIRWARLTLLHDGSVLVSGGYTDDFKPISSWAIYSPERNRFVKFGRMSVARAGHTATLLEGNRVLITGGAGADYTETSFNSAEILDISTGESMLLPDSMSHCRNGHAGVLLDNGMVLLIGGYWPKHDLSYNTVSELFDPRTMKFKDTGAMGRSPYYPSACKLGGNVIVIGGGNGTRVVEIYDPKRGQFYIAKQLLKKPRLSGFTITRIDSASFVIIGGCINDYGDESDTIEIVKKRRVIGHKNGLIRIGRKARIDTDGIDAIVEVYRGRKFIGQIPVKDFQPREHYFKDDPFLKNLADICKGVGDISLVVSFFEGCSHAKRVNLLHFLGLSNIEHISVGGDLQAGKTTKKFGN